MSNDERDSTARGTTFNGWWLASACLILLILLAGGVVLTRNLVHRDSPSAAPVAEPQEQGASGTRSAPVDGESPSMACTSAPTPTMKTAGLESPPADASWEAHGGLLVPVSPTFGPSSRRSPAVWACYSRTPAGALLAAINISSQTSGPGAAQVLREQALPGPQRDAALQQAEATPDAQPAPGRLGSIAGYKILSFDQARATVQIVAAGTRGDYVMSTLAVEWSGSDWRVDYDPVGGSVPPVNLPSLAGYIEWGAA